MKNAVIWDVNKVRTSQETLVGLHCLLQGQLYFAFKEERCCVQRTPFQYFEINSHLPSPATRCPKGIQEHSILYSSPILFPYPLLCSLQLSRKVLFGHLEGLELPSCSISYPPTS
jgi:hypothetical protein